MQRKGIKMEKNNMEETKRDNNQIHTGNPEIISSQEEQQFQAELAELMREDSSGKKKKKDKGKKRVNGQKKGAKKFIIATAIIAVAVGGFVFLKPKQQKATIVNTTPLTKGTIEQELTISGPVSGTDSVDVVSNLHSEVTDIQVKEGDRVEQGQLLAVIDDSDVRKELDMAQNTYDLAVSTYNEQQILAENGYAKAVQERNAAQKDYDRLSVLFQAGSVSQQEWETAQNRLRDAERDTRAFTLQDGKPVANESYALQIKNAEFELEKKKEQLKDTQVTAPISGTVVRVNAKVGRFADTIEDDRPMFIIENLDVLEIKVSVSEYSIGQIEVGQEAIISADILNGETVKGEVTAISPTGEEKGGGSTERVIPTTIRIIEDNTKLIAGITARAKIILEQSEDAWIVPISSVLETEDGNYVMTVENGAVKWISVERGVESDIQMEVIPVDGESFTEGMGIITAPSPNLTEGMQVVENAV
ncbi:MAG: efflux RND transporter periplasmic adaptor subunit [Hungatella sp.]|nr:efflux RND transporter periplasmic adaptor subunit [Hungatella sp.]